MPSIKESKKMNDLGVILCYTANTSLLQLDGHRILINGESAAKNLTELAQELGKHESIFFVVMTDEKYLLIDIDNIEIYLNPEQNLNDKRFRLLQKYPRIVYFQTFSNVPNLNMITT
jgi:hypothetical protein